MAICDGNHLAPYKCIELARRARRACAVLRAASVSAELGKTLQTPSLCQTPLDAVWTAREFPV